jgi:hypothetical protein
MIHKAAENLVTAKASLAAGLHRIQAVRDDLVARNRHDECYERVLSAYGERICVSVEVHRTKVFLPIVKVLIQKACSRADRKTEDQQNAKAAALALHPLVWQTLFGLWYTAIDTAFKEFDAEFAAERARSNSKRLPARMRCSKASST